MDNRRSFIYGKMNLLALALACILFGLPSCGTTPSHLPSGRNVTSANGQADSSNQQGTEPEAQQAPEAQPQTKQQQQPSVSLTCKERQGRAYVAPKDLPTWENGMRVLVGNRCLPCHNRNFAAAGLQLITYEDHETAADSSLRRIHNGLLKPIASHEAYSIQLWLLNGLPRTEADLDDWNEDRCVTLP